MAKMKEKILSAGLALSMALGVAPMNFAFAADEEKTSPILWEANFDGTDDTTYWAHENSSNILDDDHTYFGKNNRIKDGVLVGTPSSFGYGKFVVSGEMTNEVTTETTNADPEVTTETLDDGTVKTTTVNTETTVVTSYNIVTTVKKTTTVKTEKDGNVTEEDPVVETTETKKNLEPRTTLFNLDNKESIMWESRIKWDYPDAYLDENGYINVDDNAFLRVNGESNNDYANLFYKVNDGLYYGGIQQNPSAGIATGERLKDNEWYIVRIYMNNKTSKMKLEFESEEAIKDGEKHTYSGDWAGMAYNRNLSKLCQLAFTRQLKGGMTTYVDYSRLVDMSLLPYPTVTYKDADLNGQTGVTVGSSAEIAFDNAITEADLDKITIDGGAVISKSLSEDGKTVTVTFDTLASKTKYTLSVADIGLNAAKDFEFVSSKDASDPYFVNYQFDGTDVDFTGWHYGGGNIDISNEMTSRISDGYLKGTTNTVGYNNYTYIFNPEIDLDNRENIVAEARIKVNYPENMRGTDNTVYEYTRFLAWNNSQCMIKTKKNEDGVTCLVYGGDDNNYGSSVITDYPIYNDKFYTYRVTMNFKTNKFKVSVWDDEGNRYDGDYVNTRYNSDLKTLSFFKFIYHGWNNMESAIDYFKIYDKDLLPGVEVSYNEETLEDKSGLPLNFEAVVSYPTAISEADVKGIVINAENVEKTLSNDKKSVTLKFNNLDDYTPYKITIPDGDGFVGGVVKFTTKWADKYVMRAEFDGYDDYSKLYNRNYDNNNYYGDDIKVSAETVADGVFSPTVWAGLEWNNGGNIDMTDKNNIVIQTRLKYTGDGEIFANDFFQTYPLADDAENPNKISTTRHAWLYLKDGNLCYYNSTMPGGVADTGYAIKKDMFYTLTVKLNFASHKYSFTIRNDNGDIASAAETNFVYNNTSNDLGAIKVGRYYGNGAKCHVDYLRVWDGNYGKAQVITAEGISLDRNTDIPTGGNVFTIAFVNDVASTDGINIKSENGREIECVLSPNGTREVMVIPQENFEYDTAYTLTVPKKLLGSDEDQKVTFRTVCDEQKSFTMPAALKDKKDLNVVYFGGSITQNVGWREHVSDKLTELFGANNVNVTNYNAGVGGTGAYHGWQRIGRDVISKDPDIVFIEFAVNDSNSATAARDMESLVRNLNNLEDRPIIIFVYTTVMDFEANTFSISEHDRIAKAYGIPTISIHDKMMTYYNSDALFKSNWDSKVYLSDGTHPGTDASKLYGEYVNSLLEHNSDKYFVLPKTNESVAALTEYIDYYYDYKAVSAKTDEEWSFGFVGDSFMLTFGEASGTYTLEVDGDTVAENVAYEKTEKGMVSYSGFGKGKHTAKITANGTVNVTGVFTIHQTGATYTAPVFDATTVTAGTLLKATAKYTAYSTEDVTLIIALYDAEDRLTAVQSVSTTTDASGLEREISTELKAKTGDVKAKAFLWDGLGTMKALQTIGTIGY